ncbi:hypothetical protein R4P64_31215 [Rhodococcus sp. IEGM 1366]|uniref:hypothetical protein n=1 Tax=Rhodococcus sp. IEGM 1366 TaxID=3082223 RepID=UPI0029531527|nr:hypothetical protein [Rhodococcus sp. IEGM 1366]MDV8070994.1 hypothetical protein [Rhodococcus sp. IEGM 1366]
MDPADDPLASPLFAARAGFAPTLTFANAEEIELCGALALTGRLAERELSCARGSAGRPALLAVGAAGSTAGYRGDGALRSLPPGARWRHGECGLDEVIGDDR